MNTIDTLQAARDGPSDSGPDDHMGHHERELLALLGPRACAGRTTVLLPYQRGQPRPEIPADAARCRRCGQVHARFHELVVVRSRAEAEAARAQNQREVGP